jgi:hypothetical protein
MAAKCVRGRLTERYDRTFFDDVAEAEASHMAQVYVKLEQGGERCCFVVETTRSATDFDHEGIRAFVREGVQVTCLRKEGAEKYGWARDAEQ